MLANKNTRCDVPDTGLLDPTHPAQGEDGPAQFTRAVHAHLQILGVDISHAYKSAAQGLPPPRRRRHRGLRVQRERRVGRFAWYHGHRA